jgi:hypothetical protein
VEGQGSALDLERPEVQVAVASLACVNQCVKLFEKLGWNSGLESPSRNWNWLTTTRNLLKLEGLSAYSANSPGCGGKI